MTCKYDKAYIGPCGKPADKSGICKEHKQRKCQCGKQAIAECCNTGFLVCGYPYCAECGKHNDCPWQ